ncbi:MAG: DUF4373 domain-containing protein [Sphingobacteriales bacterium]|nr:MAG: DUF4373 domain-containing protein [Sphingobacteriales bacterium]
MPKAKTLRHATDARTNEKIAALVGDHGPAGYGVYWMIIEMLHSEGGTGIGYNEKRMIRLGGQVGMEREAFALLLKDLIEVYELLVVVDELLVSPISYTGRSKARKEAGDTHTVIETTTEESDLTEGKKEATAPIPEGYTAKDMERHHYMTALVTARSKIKDHQIKPLAIDESLYIYEHYAEKRITAALDRIQQVSNPRAFGETAYNALRRLLDDGQ